MLGDMGTTVLKLKGAEMVGLFEYLLMLIKRERERERAKIQSDDVDVHSLMQAGEDLFSLMDLFRSMPRKMSLERCRECRRLALRHCKNAERGGVHIVPKHHMLLHMAYEVRERGSPKYYATWRDETVNKGFANAAFSCHRRVMERKCLQKVCCMLQGLVCFGLKFGLCEQPRYT